MTAPRSPGATSRDDLANRLTAVLSGVDLDCACRERLIEALSSFNAMERMRHRRARLNDARNQVAGILSLLDLLGELDSVGFQESDRSVFEEIAHLFEDVAEAARRGAADMRELAAGDGPEG
ncbi:hypothetical protein ACLB6G_11070 [Zhengella sp. ZM62]|uniref:hypothetical protein n=1 Tax=Zhengella sedimenti TaxID=3390035 RepID=UPI0039768556